MDIVWQQILTLLENSLDKDDFKAWIQPLLVELEPKNKKLILVANNTYLRNNIVESFSSEIQAAIESLNLDSIDGFIVKEAEPKLNFQPKSAQTAEFKSHLNDFFTFNSFVEGKSNQMALSASKQVIKNPGISYNPLFIYGATGLGKTHLIHSIGHEIKHSGKNRVLYVRTEAYVRNMINSIKTNKMDQFKDFYQSLDALLVDDIQFLAGKERSEEEFFYHFNYLLESNSQVIITCDRYPKEIDNLANRLTSRLGSGLTTLIDPPEFETRVSILYSKAKIMGFDIPEETIYFIAELVKSNVRELEGALKNVTALGKISNSKLTIELAKKALNSLISAQSRIHSIENIQQKVARYFNIGFSDIISKGRSRSIVRPRQLAMALAHELTEKSLPEIGKEFGGRDHTTVIHACKKVKELKDSNNRINDDYQNLLRQLSV